MNARAPDAAAWTASASPAPGFEGGVPKGRTGQEKGGVRLQASERTYRYDGTFGGLLSLVFEAYARRERPGRIEALAHEAPARLFGPALVVASEAGRADRVRQGLVRHLAEAGVDLLYHAFLSERPGIEETLFALMEAVFAQGGGVLTDLRFSPALAVERLAHRVRSEVHRMHAFVRFERRAGDLFVARIRPDFHVLPLLPPHFTARYPAQRWALADVGRGLALLHEPGAPCASPSPTGSTRSHRPTTRRAFRRCGAPTSAPSTSPSGPTRVCTCATCRAATGRT